jgi:acetolactate synthase I/III small subunit
MPSSDGARTKAPDAVLRLLVRNHPGVMGHVCGLLSRRAFDLEAIACLPMGDDVDDGARSHILILVKDDGRLEQLILQLRKLQDVLEIERAHHGRTEFETLYAGFG